MIKFLHAADVHLDAPFAALSPEQAAGRRQETVAQRVNEMLTAWEKELQKTREGLEKEAQDGRNEESDN